MRRRGHWGRRRGPELRLEELPSGVPGTTSARRITDATRERAATALGRAQREGRFGSSDLYERRMAGLPSARRQRDLDDLLADLDDLVPGRVRDGMLRLIARAHADGRLDFVQFSMRSDRCLGPLTRLEADALVHDLGYRVAWANRGLLSRSEWAAPVRRVAALGGAGGIVGAGLVAVPAGIDLPGGISLWLPLAIATGVFTGLGTAIAAVAWMVRRPVRRLPERASTLGERGDDVRGHAPGSARTRHVPAMRLGGGDR